MLLVQLGINSTRDVWKFAKLDSPRRLVQFWQNFQTLLVLLIPNCTRHRMITYTNTTLKTLIFSNFSIAQARTKISKSTRIPEAGCSKADQLNPR
jgi:hypothetical protein